MSKNNPKRATRRRPAGSRIPDVVIVNDGTKPATRDNIREIVEIKFPPDTLRPGQLSDYRQIAGDKNKVRILDPARCGCADPAPEPQPIPATISPDEATESLLLTLALVTLILDDIIPTPVTLADDLLIPPVVMRLVAKLAPLLQRLSF